MSTPSMIMAGYFVACFISWPICSRALLIGVRHVNEDDLVFAVGMGAVASFLWPLVVPGFLIYKWLNTLSEEKRL